jgi:hypothetical protein
MRAREPHPFDVVARVLAERLGGRAPSEQLDAAIRSSRIAWEPVLRAASEQFVLPAFAAALRDLGLIGSLEEELGAFLLAVHAANLERNGELGDELAAAVGILNRAGIEPVLLKGGIRLVDRLYPDRGWRMLRDLDLLVPCASLAAAIRAFEQAGFRRLDLGATELARPEGLAHIDLHAEPLSAPGDAGLLCAAEVFEASRPAAFGNLSARLPSLEHQLVHLIGHGQIRHMGYALGDLRLRDRLEAAALWRSAAGSIDLQAVSARFAAAGYRRPLATFLLALNDGGWCAVPVPERSDWLVALQRRRIALQARSTTFRCIGARAGDWVSAIRSQLVERDDGERRVMKNLKRMLFEAGAAARRARAFLDRGRHVVHVLPHLSWFGLL